MRSTRRQLPSRGGIPSSGGGGWESWFGVPQSLTAMLLAFLLIAVVALTITAVVLSSEALDGITALRRKASSTDNDAAPRFAILEASPLVPLMNFTVTRASLGYDDNAWPNNQNAEPSLSYSLQRQSYLWVGYNALTSAWTCTYTPNTTGTFEGCIVLNGPGLLATGLSLSYDGGEHFSINQTLVASNQAIGLFQNWGEVSVRSDVTGRIHLVGRANLFLTSPSALYVSPPLSYYGFVTPYSPIVYTSLANEYDAEWTELKPISTGYTDYTRRVGAHQPNLALHGTTRYLVYVYQGSDYLSQGSQIMLQVWDDTTDYLVRVPVSPLNGEVDLGYPRVFVHGSTVSVVYASGEDIMLSRSTDGGANFGDHPKRLTRSGLYTWPGMLNQTYLGYDHLPGMLWRCDGLQFSAAMHPSSGELFVLVPSEYKGNATVSHRHLELTTVSEDGKHTRTGTPVLLEFHSPALPSIVVTETDMLLAWINVPDLAYTTPIAVGHEVQMVVALGRRDANGVWQISEPMSFANSSFDPNLGIRASQDRTFLGDYIDCYGLADGHRIACAWPSTLRAANCPALVSRAAAMYAEGDADPDDFPLVNIYTACGGGVSPLLVGAQDIMVSTFRFPALDYDLVPGYTDSNYGKFLGIPE